LKNFGLAVLKKNQGSIQRRNPKRSTMIKPSQQDSRTSGTKGSLVQGGSQIKRKTFQKYNASNYQKYGHYKNQCPEPKKRKEKHEASIVEEKEPTKKTKQDGRDFFF
jgi:hypothetical protein